MDSGGSKKRMQVLFSGRVQGVGFRYAVCSIAESFKVAGFVRNRMDGDVEVVAEGVEQELAGFLHEIQDSSLKRHIARTQLRWEAATGEYDHFKIGF